MDDVTRYRLALFGKVAGAIFNSSKMWVFIFFIALMYFKVVHHADISWVWVFGPFWIPMAIVVGICVALFVLFLLFMAIAYLVDVANGKV